MNNTRHRSGGGGSQANVNPLRVGPSRLVCFLRRRAFLQPPSRHARSSKLQEGTFASSRPIEFVFW